MERYRNNKSGETYVLLYSDVMDATNYISLKGMYVVYRREDNPNIIWIREQVEFCKKFTKID
jgi:predicted ATP-grasp superfamily ATP-dependent carboligase